MSIDLSQFHQSFFEESSERLQEMETALLALDPAAPDEELINTIFRSAHSIKGAAGTFGFTDIGEFTHLLETLLEEVREASRTIDDDAVSTLLESVDCLKVLLDAERDGTDKDHEQIDTLAQALRELIEGEGAGGDPAPVTDEGAAPAEPAAPDEACFEVRFAPHTQLLITGNEPIRLIRELGRNATATAQVDPATIPAFASLDPVECHLAWTIRVQGDVTEEAIREVFEWVEDECDLEVENLTAAAPTDANDTKDETDSAAAPTPASEAAPAETPVESAPETAVAEPSATPVSDPAPAPDKAPVAEKAAKPAAPTDAKKAAPKAPASASAPSKPKETSIRVGIEKIDDIINIVGELVITQSMLSEVGEDFDMSRIENLKSGLVQLQRNTRDLQEAAMRIRMLPIGFAFQRFPRMVRDLAKKLGKQIRLELSGEQTELDKTVMEQIGDPLVHIVRNAVDHAIELPDERTASGKNPEGTIHLSASHQGGNILIQISDDGRGLDTEKILGKAIERGLVDPSEASELDESAIFRLIFAPGFSTAEAVSDLSGRGVGMDVVRRNIKELGGSVDVHSELGKGTKITISLPLTLAILDGQLVRVGDQIYVVPLVSIVESLQIAADNYNRIGRNGEVYNIRNEYIQIVRLHDAFGIPTSSDDIMGKLMVVVEDSSGKAGIVVDDLLAQQQVVIKSLETNFQKVLGLAGATILGDGTVALIIDVEGLIRLSKTTPHKTPRAASTEEPAAEGGAE